MINSMDNNDFTTKIDNKDEFINNVKDQLDVTAFNALNMIKKELATNFIKGEKDETTKS
tara:strand:+ start:9797 stop:9973 length:177 start_codon:yes stop_codon:yes gene_type:complete